MPHTSSILRANSLPYYVIDNEDIEPHCAEEFELREIVKDECAQLSSWHTVSLKAWRKRCYTSLRILKPTTQKKTFRLVLQPYVTQRLGLYANIQIYSSVVETSDHQAALRLCVKLKWHYGSTRRYSACTFTILDKVQRSTDLLRKPVSWFPTSSSSSGLIQLLRKNSEPS